MDLIGRLGDLDGQDLLEREEQRDSIEQAPGQNLESLSEELEVVKQEAATAREEVAYWQVRG